MLRPNLQTSLPSSSTKNTSSFAWHKRPIFLSGDGAGVASFPVVCKPFSGIAKKKNRNGHSSSITTIKAIASSSSGTERVTRVKAVVSVLSTVGTNLSNVGLDRASDDIADFLGKTLLLELVAAELDPSK